MNKFNLTCKGAQFELLADDGYQNVLTMLNSAPYDFNIANVYQLRRLVFGRNTGLATTSLDLHLRI